MPSSNWIEKDEENVIEEEQGISQENAQIPDPEGQMPGQLPSASEAVQPDYQSRKRVAVGKLKELIGKEVIIKSGRDQICWAVEAEHSSYWRLPFSRPFLNVIRSDRVYFIRE